MKDVFAVLRQREMDLARVREEIDAIRLVIPLLIEERDDAANATNVFSTYSRRDNKWPLEIHPNRATLGPQDWELQSRTVDSGIGNNSPPSRRD